MKRPTRLFLLAGCSVLLVLEGPRTLGALAEGWSGPYLEPGAAQARRQVVTPTRTAAAERFTGASAGLGAVTPLGTSVGLLGAARR